MQTTEITMMASPRLTVRKVPGRVGADGAFTVESLD